MDPQPTSNLTVKLDAGELEHLLRDHGPAFLEAAHALRAEARGLLDFIPAGVNPVVLTVERITGVRDAAEQLLAFIVAPTLRTTADVAEVDR